MTASSPGQCCRGWHHWMYDSVDFYKSNYTSLTFLALTCPLNEILLCYSPKLQKLSERGAKVTVTFVALGFQHAQTHPDPCLNYDSPPLLPYEFQLRQLQHPRQPQPLTLSDTFSHTLCTRACGKDLAGQRRLTCSEPVLGNNPSRCGVYRDLSKLLWQLEELLEKGESLRQ